MSGLDLPAPPSDTTHNVLFSTCLTPYTKGEGRKAKEVKKNKTKRFEFVVSDINYLKLLHVWLKSHGMEQYKVTVKHTFGFKYAYL